MNIKEKLYNRCYEFIESRSLSILKTIDEIQESLTTETKSSAGDKHETGRAMLQLEREKAGNQLAEIQKIKEAFFKIEPSKMTRLVSLGSVVYTSDVNYFVAISVGEIEIDAVKFYAISPSTPIGKLLVGKKEGDQINFRNTSFKITKLF